VEQAFRGKRSPRGRTPRSQPSRRPPCSEWLPSPPCQTPARPTAAPVATSTPQPAPMSRSPSTIPSSSLLTAASVRSRRARALPCPVGALLPALLLAPRRRERPTPQSTAHRSPHRPPANAALCEPLSLASAHRRHSLQAPLPGIGAPTPLFATPHALTSGPLPPPRKTSRRAPVRRHLHTRRAPIPRSPAPPLCARHPRRWRRSPFIARAKRRPPDATPDECTSHSSHSGPPHLELKRPPLSRRSLPPHVAKPLPARPSPRLALRAIPASLQRGPME
jgi:hypothetical protein